MKFDVYIFIIIIELICFFLLKILFFIWMI